MSSKDVGKQFGLLDADLKTPGHDALLLWADEHHLAIWERVSPDVSGWRTPLTIRCVWEKPIMSGKFIVGYWDAWIGPHETLGIGVEIKTTIPSLGELVRQLRTYEKHQWYGEHPPVVIVSTESRWEKQLVSQGFHYIDPTRAL